MKKRMLSILLITGMLLALLPVSAAAAYSGSCGNGLTWTLENDVLTISGNGAMPSYNGMDNPAPWHQINTATTIQLEPGVTSVGSRAFSGCSTVRNVILPSTVTTIGDNAFSECTSLASVTLPEGVTSIGAYSFYGCENLTSAAIPDGVSTIGAGAFCGCSRLGSIAIPSGLTEIAAHTFSYCTSLREVKIPSGVTSIGSGAFDSCTGLTEIVIPDSVTEIEYSTFSQCENLQTVTFPDTLEYMGELAFGDCTALKSLVLPGGKNPLQVNAFYHCSGLTSVTIPETLEQIRFSAFNGCRSLTQFLAEPGNPSYCTVDGVVYDKSMKTLYYYPDGKTGASFTCPTGVQQIANGAFPYGHRLTGVVLPNTVTYIDGDAFAKDHKTVIYGQLGSAAEQFAKRYQFMFRPLCVNGHVYEAGTVTKPSTVTEKGTIAYRCSACSDTGTAELPRNPFQDVKYSSGTAWYYLPTFWAVEQGITTGADQTHFEPETACSRAMVVTFLWRAAGQPIPLGVNRPFEDVAYDSYYSSAVLWAVEHGITTGADETHFEPDAPCDRAMVATFLWRANGQPAASDTVSPFTDVTGDYYYDAVLWASENEVVNGMTATTFKPHTTCSRSHVVTMLYRNAMHPVK